MPLQTATITGNFLDALGNPNLYLTVDIRSTSENTVLRNPDDGSVYRLFPDEGVISVRAAFRG